MSTVPLPYFADTYIYLLHWRASFARFPSMSLSSLVFESCFRPHKTRSAPGICSLISFAQRICKSFKVSRSSRENHNITTCASLYANLRICTYSSFSFGTSTSSTLYSWSHIVTEKWKLSQTAAPNSSGNAPYMYDFIRLVLPTPEFPTTKHLISTGASSAILKYFSRFWLLLYILL